MTYEESLKQLEDIVRKMEAGDYSIDELAEKLEKHPDYELGDWESVEDEPDERVERDYTVTK